MKQLIMIGFLLMGMLGKVNAEQPTFQVSSDNLIALQSIEAMYQIKYELLYQQKSIEQTIATLRSSMQQSSVQKTLKKLAMNQTFAISKVRSGSVKAD